MCIYYLYVKTHCKTGLKYLGYTSKEDPHKYSGSGKYWLRHLKIHGKNYETKILYESSDKLEIKNQGLYYSNIWNIVDSDEWANLKPESGDGAGAGKYNHMMNPIIREKHKKKISDPIIKEKHRLATISAMNRKEVYDKVKKARNTPQYKEMIKRKLNSPEIIAKRAGSGNPKYDHTIYSFFHVSGITECCTRLELEKKYNLDQGNLSRLISGKHKIIKGWKILNLPVVA